MRPIPGDARKRLADTNRELYDEFDKTANILKQDPQLANSVDAAFEDVCRTALKKPGTDGGISNPGGYLRCTAERIQRERGKSEAGEER